MRGTSLQATRQLQVISHKSQEAGITLRAMIIQLDSRFRGNDDRLPPTTDHRRVMSNEVHPVNQNVTGPSFVRVTCMSAPKIPYSTFLYSSLAWETR